MKKLLTIAALLICFISQAQDSPSNMIILAGGAAIPMGDFGATSDNPNSGFAKTGFSGEVIFQHKLKKLKYFGYSASVRLQNYSFNQSAFTTATNVFSTTATNWTSSSILAGPTWTFAVSNKISIEPRAMVGILFASSPTLTIDADGIYVQPSESANTITYLAGVNFRFDLWPKISLFARADYQSATPKFAYSSQSSTNQPMSSLNTSIGVGYRF